MTATDGDKDRKHNIVYFLTGQGIDTDQPEQSKFDINKTTGEIFVLKVKYSRLAVFLFVTSQRQHFFYSLSIETSLTDVRNGVSRCLHKTRAETDWWDTPMFR